MIALGLDIGTKRIGVAKWSPETRVVTPTQTVLVKRPKDALMTIHSLIQEHEATHLILGYPLMPNGEPGELAQLVRRWQTKLIEATDCKVILWDERMTSKLAEQDMRLLGLNTKQQRKFVDVAAAMRILDSWITAKQTPDHV